MILIRLASLLISRITLHYNNVAGFRMKSNFALSLRTRTYVAFSKLLNKYRGRLTLKGYLLKYQVCSFDDMDYSKH